MEGRERELGGGREVLIVILRRRVLTPKYIEKTLSSVFR